MNLYNGQLGSAYDGSKLVVGHVDGPFKDLGVRGAKRGYLAIGAVTATSSIRAGLSPRPKGTFIGGNIRQFRARLLDFLLEMAREYGPLANFRKSEPLVGSPITYPLETPEGSWNSAAPSVVEFAVKPPGEPSWLDRYFAAKVFKRALAY